MASGSVAVRWEEAEGGGVYGSRQSGLKVYSFGGNVAAALQLSESSFTVWSLYAGEAFHLVTGRRKRLFAVASWASSRNTEFHTGVFHAPFTRGTNPVQNFSTAARPGPPETKSESPSFSGVPHVILFKLKPSRHTVVTSGSDSCPGTFLRATVYLRMGPGVERGGHVWSYCARTCCQTPPARDHPRWP